jgi:hypothetical protein
MPSIIAHAGNRRMVLRVESPPYKARKAATLFYWFLKFLAIGPLLKLVFRPWAEGVENVPREGSAILASNHLSYSDWLFMPIAIPRRVTFVAKAEYFESPGLKGWLQKKFFAGSGQVPIDRTSGSAAAGAIKTQLRLRVQNLAAPDPRLIKIALKLDGSPVFVGDGNTLSGDDARQVFEGFIAPGPHVLTAEIEQQSREDASFGYSLHDTYSFKVQRDKLSELTLIVDDDSDMASDYPDDGDGEYDVRLKLRVRTKNLGEE